MRRALVVLAAVAALAGCSLGAGGDGESYTLADCTPRAHEGSVAQVWNEALLAAIRRDVPAPTVHARNLFHVSAAMWDAWAAYDPAADGYFVTEKHEADDVAAAREAAISFAAYRILLERYSIAAGLERTFAELPATMAGLCYRIGYTATEGDSPAALGNRIAERVLAAGRDDGSNEERRYADPDYRPVNAPLVVEDGAASMRDPNRWQPLALARIVAQNGLPVPGRVQTFVGSQWGHVRAFALPPPAEPGLPVDPGPPPLLGDPETDDDFKQAAVEVLRYSSMLDPRDSATVDASPAELGNNPLGTNAGRGHPQNPATGEPYAPAPVRRGDFMRAVTEFWADGPESETPPGHWNTIANEVSAAPGTTRRIGGRGRPVDRLEWDVKLYFALNGAVHDAAVAAWGAKRHYDSVRPISMVRYMGGKGQSSDPDGPSYDPDGLPLVPGLIELVTRSSAAPGARHPGLPLGEIAVRAWRGPPADPAAETSGAGWIRAVDWMPYQRATFVSPAFAGYVSGHSTFSRAAAEVMTAFTGSPFFPGGLLEWRVPAGAFVNERGPERDVTLAWGTYYDAADQAGISRLYGGIHISADDFEGRKLGSRCGKDAWARAQRYFSGEAR